MDSDLRRALWATARIAGLGVLVGCAPQVGVVIPENPVPTSQDVPDEPIDEEPTCAELFKDLNERAEAGEDTRNPDEAASLQKLSGRFQHWVSILSPLPGVLTPPQPSPFV